MALRLFVWALVMSWFVGGAPVAVAGPAKPGAVESEDEKEVENSGAALRHIPCQQVIAHIDHGRKHKQVTNSEEIAKQMHTSVLAVDRCMEAYGRRMKEEVHGSAEAREARLENLEVDEPEEPGSEELGEEMNEQDRKELRRLQPHPDYEKRLRVNARPTPGGDEDEYGNYTGP